LLTYRAEAARAGGGNGLAAGGGVAAHAPASASPAARPRRLRVGIMGAGQFASGTLIPAIKKAAHVELATVCNATGLSARHAQKKFGFARATTSETELLADSTINTVVIATRHDLHARQVLAALAAGKHVFCEKPLCLRADELVEIEHALAAQSSATLMVGYNRRFAPMARSLKQFFASSVEPLVMHYRVNAGFIPTNHWVHDPEQGGGRIIGEVCHFIDFSTFIAGAAPVRVFARALPNAGRYRDDNLVITLEHANGALGTISYVANGDKAVAKERVEVFGGGAVGILDNFRQLELVRDGRTRTEKARLDQDKGHRAEWEAFARAVQRGGAPPIPMGELFSTTRASFAVVESLQTGLPIDVVAAG
jgi:predicted dehydrogenase